jgi:O-succinylbenzoic acid--CoA ligase
LEYTPDHNKSHRSFEINGQRYNAKSIKTLAFNHVANGSQNEIQLGNLILEWVDDTDFIAIQTSGTTSTPKAIRIPKASFINSAKATAIFFDLVAGDSALCCLPISFIAGKMMFVRAWVLGLKLDVIEPSSFPLERLPEKFYDFSAMVPLQLQNSISKMNQIKTLLVGGASVSEALALKLKGHTTTVFETFGMTETVSHIAAKNLSLGESFFEVLPGIEVTQDERDCLVVSAPQLSTEILTTNDVVSIVSDTAFKWLGRYDNVINSGGVKIHPERLEKQLQKQLKVRFFIAALTDETLGQKVVLIIEGEVKELELYWHQIDPINRPKNIYFVPVFLETSSGKIQRQKTLELLNLNQS